MKKVFSKIVFSLAFLFVGLVFAAGVNAKENDLPVVTEANEETAKAAKVSTGDYVMVTSASDLVVGRKVIIASQKYNYAMSKTQSTNYRKEVSLKKTTSDGKTVVTPTSNVGVFTLIEGSIAGTYGFYDDYYGGYLCAASSSSNTLKTARDLDDYSSFSISVTSSGVATVKANYFSRNLLRYNYYSGYFACYSSKSQYDVAIFQEYVGGSTNTNVNVTGVSLDVTNGKINVGESGYLTATVTPSNATNKNVTWKSSNTSVATVNSNGLVTGVKAGSCVITVTTADGGYTASCNLTVESTTTTVAVTGVSLNASSLSLTAGETSYLTATVKPTNATNQNVTWKSANTAIATVNSNGLVTAVAAGTTKITVTTADGGYTASATVTVASAATPDPEPQTGKAAWTIMIYMCGADLESQNGLATSDIKEILSVSNQPSDVNIIIQTGGANSWKSTYGINANYTQRYHVANNKLVLDNSLSKANMGLTSTFQSFLEWGLTSYPAEKTGVIMWNHGGAMRGVCYDENYSDDCLLNSEVKSAVSSALSKTNNSKLEFIGYDACLMSVQDIAEFNSNYFNYMIASEESESGYGWDYDTWVDDLYAKKTTANILKAIVDGFIKDNGGTSSSSNDQTLAYLNLSYMSAYKTAWENMASALMSKITSSNKSKFNTLVKSAKYYGDSYYTYYGIFDAKDFTNKLASNSTFNPGSTYTNAVLNAHANLVQYSSCGRGAGNSYGLCMFYSISSNCQKGTYYTSSQTNFTNWRNLVSTYGA